MRSSLIVSKGWVRLVGQQPYLRLVNELLTRATAQELEAVAQLQDHLIRERVNSDRQVEVLTKDLHRLVRGERRLSEELNRLKRRIDHA